MFLYSTIQMRPPLTFPALKLLLPLRSPFLYNYTQVFQFLHKEHFVLICDSVKILYYLFYSFSSSNFEKSNHSTSVFQFHPFLPSFLLSFLPLFLSPFLFSFLVWKVKDKLIFPPRKIPNVVSFHLNIL